MALATATIIALGGAAIGGGMNLIQAAEARDRQTKADDRASELMADAKRKVEKDFYEGLKMPMDAYEQAEKANLQQQQQNIEALQQADSRTLAAGVGRVGMLANQNTEQLRAMKAKEMFELDKIKAGNKDDMNQQLIQMDVAAAQDQAARAAQADEQVGALQAGAANAFIGGITSAAESQALYPKKKMDPMNTLVTKAGNTTALKVNNDGLSVNKVGNYQNPTTASVSNPNLNMFNKNQNSFIPSDLYTQGGGLKFSDKLFMNPFSPSGIIDVDYGFSFEDRMKRLGDNRFRKY